MLLSRSCTPLCCGLVADVLVVLVRAQWRASGLRRSMAELLSSSCRPWEEGVLRRMVLWTGSEVLVWTSGYEER